jgi:hypothetical protein
MKIPSRRFKTNNNKIIGKQNNKIVPESNISKMRFGNLTSTGLFNSNKEAYCCFNSGLGGK